MKFRKSFVTNSSSSSYIISTSKENKERMNDFYNIVENITGYESDAPILITSESKLNSYVKERYDMSLPELLNGDDEYYKERYGKILEELKSGNIVLMQEVDYDVEDLYDKILYYVLKDYKRVTEY